MTLLAHGVLLAGALLLVLAAVGVVILPDALTRQHAATKSGTLALALICTGSAGSVGDAAWTLRLLAIVLILFVTLPIASHLLARAAVVEADAEQALRDAPLLGGSGTAATGEERNPS